MSSEVPTVRLEGRGVAGLNYYHLPFQSIAAFPASESVKLGRVAPKAKPQALRLAAFLGPRSAPPPVKVDYAAKAMPSISRMYGNDRYGDCVIVTQYHEVGVWSGNDNPPCQTVADNEVLEMYNRLKAGPGDSGCIITDVLDYARQVGMPVNGRPHKIDGYVSVDHTNKLEVQTAVYLFGSVEIGFLVPQSWMSQDVWDVTNSPTVGGHSVAIVGYDERGVIVSSWGRLYLMTWAAFTSTRWVDECYAKLAPLWYGDDRLAPVGLNVEKLRAALEQLGGSGPPPDVDPPQPPPPPKPPEPPVPPTPTPTSFTISLAGQVPGGFWGTPRDIELHGVIDPIDVTLIPSCPDPAKGGSADVWVLVLKYAAIALPIVLAGRQAGKSWAEIAVEVFEAIAKSGQ